MFLSPVETGATEYRVGEITQFLEISPISTGSLTANVSKRSYQSMIGSAKAANKTVFPIGKKIKQEPGEDRAGNIVQLHGIPPNITGSQRFKARRPFHRSGRLSKDENKKMPKD